MPLSFGDVAGTVGQDISGLLGGMRTAQMQNQQMALRAALERAQIGNLQEEGTFRGAMAKRWEDEDARQQDERKRRVGMIPSLVHQINVIGSEKGMSEPTLPETPEFYESTSPEYLQAELLRRTQGLQSIHARQEVAGDREYNADMQYLRDTQDHYQNFMIAGPDGTSMFQTAFPQVAEGYNSVYKKRMGRDFPGYKPPVVEPKPGAKVPPGGESSGLDTPGKGILDKALDIPYRAPWEPISEGSPSETGQPATVAAASEAGKGRLPVAQRAQALKQANPSWTSLQLGQALMKEGYQAGKDFVP
jgi:hypothetical protein